MSCRIEACIENGKPSLKIWNSSDQSLCLSWRYGENNSGETAQSQNEVHRLFRQLLLLTLKDDVSNVRVFQLSNETLPIHSGTHSEGR